MVLEIAMCAYVTEYLDYINICDIIYTVYTRNSACIPAHSQHTLNTVMKAIAFFVFIVTTIFCSAQTTPTPIYPVYPSAVVDATENIRAEGHIIHGEGTDCWEYEFIVIPTGDARGATIFRVTFDWHGILPNGFKIPVLTEVGRPFVYPAYPLGGAGWWQYEDGTKVYYGELGAGTTTKFFYAWSWIDELGREKWSTVVTWGEGAGIDHVGTQIDRSQFATRPGEPRELGFRILDIYTRNGKPILGILSEEKAQFTLEASPNLKTWRPISSTFETLPELDTWIDGVWFNVMIVEPIPEHGISFGKTQFFRLRTLP